MDSDLMIGGSEVSLVLFMLPYSCLSHLPSPCCHLAQKLSEFGRKVLVSRERPSLTDAMFYSCHWGFGSPCPVFTYTLDTSPSWLATQSGAVWKSCPCAWPLRSPCAVSQMMESPASAVGRRQRPGISKDWPHALAVPLADCQQWWSWPGKGTSRGFLDGDIETGCPQNFPQMSSRAWLCACDEHNCVSLV